MAFRYNPFTGNFDYYEESIPTDVPSNIVRFDTLDPNTLGTIFTNPTTGDPGEELDTDTLYISDIDSSQWTSNGVTYEMPTITVSGNTPFNILGTIIDVGNNKVVPVERNGSIFLLINQTGVGFAVQNSKNTGSSNGVQITRGASTTGGYGLQVLRGSTNQLRTNHDGSLLINDVYTLPSTAGTSGQVLKFPSSGNLLEWGTASPIGQSMIVDQTTGVYSYFTTPELALASAITGDTIIVFSGTYTIATTATNGIAKDGVNWFVYPGVVFNKASAGDMFNDTGFTIGCNIYGYGDFNKSSGAGNVHNYNVSLDWVFEFRNITNSAVGLCINNNTPSVNPTNKARIKGLSAIASAGIAIQLGNCRNFDLDVTLIRSTSSTGLNLVTTNSGVDTLFGTIKSSLIESTVGSTNGFANVRSCNVVCNVADCNQATFGSSVTYIIWNGRIKKLSIGSGNIVINGTVQELASTAGTVKITHVEYVNLATGSGVLTIGKISGQSINHVFGGTGTYIIDEDYSGSRWFTKTSSATLIFRNKVTGGTNSTAATLAISSGSVIFEKGFTFGSASNRPAITLSGGTLDITGPCTNLDTGVDASIVTKTGGTFINRNTSLVVTNSEVSPVILTNSVSPTINIQGQLFTNSTALGGMLTGKKKKYKITIQAVANTSSKFNNGTGGGDVTISETDTATYNTIPLLAQRMTVLGNASLTIDALFSQDTPGTDTYFYVEADVVGDPFTFTPVSGDNVDNGSVLRASSYPLTILGGGSLIEDTNVI